MNAIPQKFFCGRVVNFLALWVAVGVLPAQAREASVRFAGADSVVRVESRARHGKLYLEAGDLQEKLKLNVERDEGAGLAVVCGARDCVPLFLAAEEDVLVEDGKLFVSARRALLAACAEAKVKREAISLSCRSAEALMRVGTEVDEFAPGFALKTVSDSLATLDNLLSHGHLLLCFVRSGDWDPVSRLLMRELQAQSDSLRKLGIGVAVIHGYDSKTARKWAKEMQISYPLLADGYAAVMRGYHMFDKGHLPRNALLAITKDKRIAWKKVFEETETVDIEEAVKALGQKR